MDKVWQYRPSDDKLVEHFLSDEANGYTFCGASLEPVSDIVYDWFFDHDRWDSLVPCEVCGTNPENTPESVDPDDAQIGWFEWNGYDVAEWAAHFSEGDILFNHRNEALQIIAIAPVGSTFVAQYIIRVGEYRDAIGVDMVNDLTPQTVAERLDNPNPYGHLFPPARRDLSTRDITRITGVYGHRNNNDEAEF